MHSESVTVSFPSTPSQRIIAAGIVIGFCYWAQSVAMTLLLSVLLAYFLDPFVEWLEALRLPRGLGALIVVLLALALLWMAGWVIVGRLDQFGADWPKYRAPLRAAAAQVEAKLERFEAKVSEITPQERGGKPLLEVTEPHPARAVLLSRLGSLYTVLLAATFVPFLVFFMLAAKRDVWHATMQLFPVSQRTRVKLALEEVGVTLRSFVVGNLLVAGIIGLASWLFFLTIDLPNSFLIGLTSGVLNLVPYMGVVLAWLPPLIVALPKYHTVGPFIAIFGVLTGIHLLALNVLIPALVGRKVRLSALAVTLSLLFWGWLWGGLGLILAIPITATLKVICDHVDGWKPIGQWLGS